jgi:transcriptional regulator with XRE-family HTH domain
MKKDFNNLNEWIPAQLERVGMSVEQLANEAGVSRTAVYRWMYDQDRPTTQNMAKIVHVLKVSLAEGLRQYVPKRTGRPPGRDDTKERQQIR